MGQPSARFGVSRAREVEDYERFVGKFRGGRRTSDDCFTPEAVFGVVRDYVYEEYGDVVDGLRLVRPFWPGGDYRGECYEGGFVLDNPPFSRLARILEFYVERGVKFFLFAPLLTMFSSRVVQDNPGVCLVVQKTSVVYENGAVVATGFLTNLDSRFRIRVSKTLTDRLYEVQAGRVKPEYRRVVKPREVFSVAMLQRFALFGDLDFGVEDVLPERGVLGFDNGGGRDGRVFGRGFLLSPGVVDFLEGLEAEGALDGKRIRVLPEGRRWLFERALAAGYSECEARERYLEGDG